MSKTPVCFFYKMRQKIRPTKVTGCGRFYMEKYLFDAENQRKVEKLLLFIYTIYSMSILIMSRNGNWGFIMDFLILAGVSSTWVTHVSKYRSYQSRVQIAAAMMQMTMVIYGVHVENVTEMLAVYMAFVVLIGLYGHAKLIWFTMVSTIMIFGYHIVISHSLPVGNLAQIGQVVSKISNIILFEYIVYAWTKRNSEGSNQLLGVIKELREVQNSKDDFVANVSHEIRTPINTICGMSEILYQENLPYEIKEKMLDIQRAGRNLMGLVSDILDFSELQSGNIELEEEAYNITTTINDVINMAMARKNEKKIELIVDCDANIPSALLGDEKKLRRVITKLMDNAVKFTKEGCVTIVIGARRESYGINLMVTIKDTGIGISPENLEKIFASFNQVDTARKRQEDGIGLGLAISQALVQKMGGAITIKSKPGKGTVVKFVVPQKVLDETPIATVKNRENLNVATFINMEQFGMEAIRDEYTNMIVHMVQQLKTRCQVCRNFMELQRRTEREYFTHVFTSAVEYREQREFFDALAEQTKVVVILDYRDEKDITNPNLIKIYKPFHILAITAVVNGVHKAAGDNGFVTTDGFTTKNAQVLAVDDNRMNLKVIDSMLGGYGIRVTKATSGHEALEKINSEEFDFVFMDHMMPEMDGVETLHAIRQKVGNYYLQVPIIALTANAVAGTREMMIGEGFNDFVEKPIERSVLERVLRRTLPAEKIVPLENREEKKNEGTVVAPGAGALGDKTSAEAVQFAGSVPSTPGARAAALPREEAKDEVLESLEKIGLNVQKGILYCNGREGYLAVLQGYCEEFEEFGIGAESLFEQQDWKNYTIEVHGIKGAMRSIGAETLSDMARLLEFAGKDGNTDYILVHHGELMEEYLKLLDNLCRNQWIRPQKPVTSASEEDDADSAEDISNLPVLGEEKFTEILGIMESAMYALNKEILLEEIQELQKYQYHGNSLKAALRPVARKVEREDYISAVELAVSIKEKLSGKES